LLEYWKNRSLYALLCVCVCMAMACPPTAPSSGYEHLNKEIRESFKTLGLGLGDVFEVRVYGEESLSGLYQVAQDGTVDFPLLGRTRAAGLTPGEVADAYKSGLGARYLRQPFVSVLVKEWNSVGKIFVLGRVNKPGTFKYRAGMNVLEAVTLAGGFSPTANEDFVVVTRKEQNGELRIPVPVGQISEGLAANLELKSGDIVFVSDRLL
jgi:protein involved in polysaccharide export with SLBB domain